MAPPLRVLLLAGEPGQLAAVNTETLPERKGPMKRSQWDWQIGDPRSLAVCSFFRATGKPCGLIHVALYYVLVGISARPQGVANIPSKVSCSQRGLYNFLVCLHCCTGYKLFLWTPG